VDPKTPKEIFEYWNKAIERIKAARERFGDEIKPGAYRP
jgi:phosphoenolpyruvate carboxykinase (GTP)